MTNLFGVGINNERLYSEQFVTKTVDDELKGKLNKLAHDVKELNQKQDFHLYFIF